MSRQTTDQPSKTVSPDRGLFRPLIPEFLGYLRTAGFSDGSIPNFPGPAKHFLVWLNETGTDLKRIDIAVVRQFFAHNCNCQRPRGERYRNHDARSRDFKAQVLQFVRFLENTNRIRNPMALQDGLQRIEDFLAYLSGQGYALGTISNHRYVCRHFVLWLHQHHIPLATVDETAIECFAEHDCICPGMFVRVGRRSRTYLARIKRFARFLITGEVIPNAASRTNQEPQNLREFRDWMRRHRGIGEQTIFDHIRTITKLLVGLGDDPHRYDAAVIKRVILSELENTSRIGIQRMTRSLRMYLRFLASNGACSPSLVSAIPTIPRWRLSTIPRYILRDGVERVISSCDLTTARGLRDRAILLLLARLALRARDVANLSLRDIDWDTALIRVSGKSRHTVGLPLSQEVGDALLNYIEHARPVVSTDRVFLRSIAPFQPFCYSSAVGGVVRNALRRADVKTANLRGAYLLRHSAATDMLRSGATLEAVGALLRHRSPETTRIYAKVDTRMLSEVAQAWIGDVKCR